VTTLAQALREAKPGEITGPIYARQALHVVRCGPVIAAGPAPLAELRAGIADRLRAAGEESALARKMRALREAARIEIDEAALAALGRTRA
jgi:hypothetical protein